MIIASTFLLATTLVSAFPLIPRQNANTSDPCGTLITSDAVSYYQPSAVKACLQGVPFRSDVRDNIIATVTALNTLNIFQYNQLGDDNPVLNQGVDLRAEFARISNTTYSSDYDFQRDLTVTVGRLNDGHFYWQSCYDTVFATTSFIPIVALQKEEGGDTAIHLAPNLPIYAEQNGLSQAFADLGYDLSKLAGAEVTSIEGQLPWTYLDQVAGLDAGTYQDPEQRLNFLLASYSAYFGGFAINPGHFTQTTSLEKNNITLSVKTQDGVETNVVSPWLTTYQSDEGWRFASAEAFYNATCLFQEQSGSGSAPSGSMNGPDTNGTDTSQSTEDSEPTESGVTPTDIDSLIQQAYTLCPVEVAAPKYQYANHPQQNSAYLGGRDVQFYALDDAAKTGVIFVPTFGPMDPSTNQPSVPCINRFVADLYLGFKNFTSAGVEKILIDTSNNGGGQVVLNQFFQRYITGEKYEVDLNFDTLLRDSPLARGLLKANIEHGTGETPGNTFAPANYRDGSEQYLANADLFDPGSSYSINGEVLKTSNTLADSIEAIDQFEGPLNISDTPIYSPSEIVFTGNGLCGSACASFTNFLIEYYNATAFIASARPQNSIEFQAFAAGQATSSHNIQAEAQSVGYTDAATLPPLQVPGKFGFTVRGALSPNIAPGKFLQYRSYPAQKTYGLTAEQWLDPIANWKFVASQVFG